MPPIAESKIYPANRESSTAGKESLNFMLNKLWMDHVDDKQSQAQSPVMVPFLFELVTLIVRPECLWSLMYWGTFIKK